MFTTNRKFTKAFQLLAVLLILSLSLTSTAWADTRRYPEQAGCNSYPGDPNCQCNWVYQCNQCYQGQQGYQCYQCYQVYQCNQNYQPYQPPYQPYPSYPAYPTYPTAQPTATPEVGTGPDNAPMLGSGPATIAARGQQWYRFPVQPPVYSDNSRGTLNIDVTLTNQSGKATFEVLSSDNVNRWENGVRYSPLGAGTDSTSQQGTPILFWHGSFNLPLTIYVLVKSNTDQPASCTLSLNLSNG